MLRQSPKYGFLVCCECIDHLKNLFIVLAGITRKLCHVICKTPIHLPLKFCKAWFNSRYNGICNTLFIY